MKILKYLSVKWQLLLLFLTLSVLPLVLLTVYSYNYLYQNLTHDKIRHYQSLLKQISKNIDSIYEQYALTLNDISEMDNLKAIINAPPYRSADEERMLHKNLGEGSLHIKGGSIRKTVMTRIKGDFVIIELDRYSLLEEKKLKKHYFSSSSSLAFNDDNFLNDPLLLELRNNPEKKCILGQFQEGVIRHSGKNNPIVMAYPYYQDGSQEFTKILLVIFQPDFFRKIYTDIDNLKTGSLFLLDHRHQVLLSSQPDLLNDRMNNKADHQTGKFELSSRSIDPPILSDPAVKQLITRTTDEDWKITTINYQGNSFLSIYGSAYQSGIQILYFFPLKSLKNTVFHLMLVIIIFSLILIVLVCFLAVIFSDRFTDPIKRLSRLSREIAHGNLMVPELNLKSGNEIGILISAFNRIVQEIRVDKETLEIKVQERTNELNQAIETIRDNSFQKTLFFVNLAHETKTPLTLIKNYLDRYIRKKGTDPDIAVVQQNINKLLRDMVNFLDAEKINQNKILYNHTDIIHFDEFVAGKIDIFRDYALRKSIRINLNTEKGILIKADPFALDRILNNLLENAVKYTETGGMIEVNISKNESQIFLIVKDNGIGIKNSQIDHLFDPFFQLSHKKSNRQGVGMGLYIVKKIIDSLNGRIDIESTENSGSTFRVTLPLYIPLPGDSPLQDLTLSQPFQYDSQSSSFPIISEYNPSKKTIFLIEDNIDMTTFLFTSLREKYNFFCASNGLDAQKRLDEMPKPDIILSDVMMDEVNGFELLKFLGEYPGYEAIPFLFLTAKTNTEAKIRGLSLGAVDYIEKPFSVEEVLLKIESILNQNEKMKREHQHFLETRMHEFFQSLDLQKPNLEPEKGEKEIPDTVQFDKIFEKYSISHREKDIFVLLFKGLLNKEISDQLNISVRTVENHVYNIYKKIGVQTRLELINRVLK